MEKFHYAFKNENISVKSIFLEHILNDTHSLSYLKNKKGLLFSNSVLQTFIEKEAKYNIQTLSSTKKRSIRTFSSGEQKKALLNYLIDKKPAFLILESPFESLDTTSVKELKEKLIRLSKELILIQIFNRKEELLPIITDVLEIKNDKPVDAVESTGHQMALPNIAMRLEAVFEDKASLKSEQSDHAYRVMITLPE